MKKIKVFMVAFVFIFVCLPVTVSAATMQSELCKDFVVPEFSSGSEAYLISPTKVGDIKGENLAFYDSSHKLLDENSYIPSGAAYTYFGEFGETTLCILLGDTNMDGLVTAGDARKAMQMAALAIQYDGIEYKAADINADGFVRANDARRILRFSAELEDFSDFEENFTQAQESDSYEYCLDMLTVYLKKEYDNSDDSLQPEFYDSELVSEVIKDPNFIKPHFTLKLRDPSKENLDKLIEVLNKNENIIVIEKIGIVTLID